MEDIRGQTLTLTLWSAYLSCSSKNKPALEVFELKFLKIITYSADFASCCVVYNPMFLHLLTNWST